MDIVQPDVLYIKTVVDVPEFILVGVQKNIKKKEEPDLKNGTIAKTYDEYFSKAIFAQIPNRLHPMRTYTLYYEYQNSEDKEEMTYKMLLGEMVSKVSDLPEGLTAVTVPAHCCCKFEVGPGPLPDVVINTWKALRKLTPAEFGGKRSFNYEFEVYPENQQDKAHTKFDLYIGITKE